MAFNPQGTFDYSSLPTQGMITGGANSGTKITNLDLWKSYLTPLNPGEYETLTSKGFNPTAFSQLDNGQWFAGKDTLANMRAAIGTAPLTTNNATQNPGMASSVGMSPSANPTTPAIPAQATATASPTPTTASTVAPTNPAGIMTTRKQSIFSQPGMARSMGFGNSGFGV